MKTCLFKKKPKLREEIFLNGKFLGFVVAIIASPKGWIIHVKK